jgi:hypothetical protein
MRVEERVFVFVFESGRERVCVFVYESGRESVYVCISIEGSEERICNEYYIRCNPAYLICGHGFCSVICDVAIDTFSL